MKTLILTILFLLGAAYRLTATDADPQQLLKAAESQADIFQENAGPFQMEVDFVVQNQVQASGHLTYKWEAKDKWWRKTTMTGYEEIDIRNGEKESIVRNIGFTPARAKELFSLFHFMDGISKLQFKKQKQKRDRGIQLSCIQVRKGEEKQTHELCIDATFHDLLSDAWNDGPDGTRKLEFSEQSEFREHKYPRQIELFINGGRAVSARIVSLTSASLDQSLLLAPKGAIERRKCEGLKHPTPVSTPDPQYPPSNSQNRLMGDTTVAMTVLTDGSVENIQLIGRSTQEMDKATLKTLKEWKFKPAMCGGEPVVYDIEVVVSFRLAP
jgi:TonB family protein